MPNVGFREEALNVELARLLAEQSSLTKEQALALLNAWNGKRVQAKGPLIDRPSLCLNTP